MMFLMKYECVTRNLCDQKVLELELKQHKQLLRKFIGDENWAARLVRVGHCEQRQITQRDPETITALADLAP